jgi:carboxylesterase
MKSPKIIPGCESIYVDGNKIGCLLLHGFTSSPFEMRLLGAHLQEKNFTLHIPLLPGHGTTPRMLKKCSWYDWFNHAKSELFQLRKKCNKIFVVGLSMGGTLALHLAAHYEVDGVAVLAPGLYLRNKFAFLTHILHSIIPYKIHFTGPDIKAQETTKTYDKTPLRSVSQLLKFFKHIKNDLPDIYAPTLIIYTRKDHVVSNKGALTIYNNISSKDKRILELSQSYHILTLDVEKQRVFHEVAKFIERLSG